MMKIKTKKPIEIKAIKIGTFDYDIVSKQFRRDFHIGYDKQEPNYPWTVDEFDSKKLSKATGYINSSVFSSFEHALEEIFRRLEDYRDHPELLKPNN